MRVVTLYHGFLSANPSTSYKPNHSVILITYALALSRICYKGFIAFEVLQNPQLA